MNRLHFAGVKMSEKLEHEGAEICGYMRKVYCRKRYKDNRR